MVKKKVKKQEFAFGVKHLAYNAEMRKRRLAMGLNQKQLGELVGIGSNSISQVEGFRSRPPRSWGEPLAEILDTEYEILFPEWMKAFKLEKSSYSTEHIVTERLLPNMVEKLMLPPVYDNTERMIDADFLKDNVKEILASLNDREKKILIMRFGLDEKPSDKEVERLDYKSTVSHGAKTLEEVGRVFGVTRDRIRQIEAKALMKLRYIAKERGMESFL